MPVDFAMEDNMLRALLERDPALSAALSAQDRGYVSLRRQDIYRPRYAVEGAVMTNQANTQASEVFVADEDIHREIPDGSGRTELIAARGRPIPMGEARRLGLVGGQARGLGPEELKNLSAPEREMRIAALREELNALQRETIGLEDAKVNEQAAEAMRQNTGDPNAKAPSVARAEARAKVDQENRERSQTQREEISKRNQGKTQQAEPAAEESV